MRTLVLLVACSLGASAQDRPASWVGEFVYAKKAASHVAFGELVDGKQVWYTFHDEYPIRVRDDRDGWIRIHDGQREAWAKKDDFVTARDAVAYFSEQIRANPTNSFAWSVRALCRSQRREYDDAIKDFDEWIRLTPQEARAYNSRGSAWQGKQDFDRAIKDFDEAIRLDPKLSPAFHNRGNAWAHKGNYDRAIRDYDEAVRLDPKNPVTYNNRAAAWFQKADYDRALKDFDESIRLDPNRGSVFNSRGNAWYCKWELDRALKDYDEAVRLDPTNALALGNRGLVRTDKRDYDGALKDFDEAGRLDPKGASHVYNRSITLLIARRPGAAAGYQKAIEMQGGSGSLVADAIIFGHAAARIEKDDAAAKRFLAEGEQLADWPGPVVRFARGNLTEPALLRLAAAQNQEAAARTYVGLDHLLNGRTAAARSQFRWVVTNGSRPGIDYSIASAELARLEKNAP